MYNTIGLGGPYGNIGNFEAAYYWSSQENESNSGQARGFRFSNGTPSHHASSILVLELVLFVHFL